MPRKMPGGFILEDEDEVPGQPTPTATATAPAPVPTAPVPPPGQNFVLDPETPAQGPPLGVPAERNTLTDILRVPYAFGRNAVTALPGLPADLGNLLGYGGTKALNFVTGQNYPFEPVPLPGQEDLNKVINKTVGVSDEPPPGWAGAPERIAGVIGSSVGPGGILGKIEPMVKLTGQTANVWNAIKSMVTSGRTGDILQGTGAGIGTEAVQQFISDNPWLKGIGGALGAITTSLLHGGVTRAAAPFQREQAVVAGEKGLQDVERLGEGITDSAARTAQAEKDRLAQEVLAAQQANKGAVAPLQADARAKQGLMTTAAEDIDRAKVLALQREADATRQGEQWITSARIRDERARARAAAQGTPPGAYEQLQPTLDLTQPPQGTKTTGEAIRENLAESGAAQTQATAQARLPAYKAATAGMGPELKPQGVIDLTKADFQPQFVKEKMQRGQNLDAVERDIAKSASKAGGMPLDNIRNQLDSFVTEAIKTPGATLSPEILAWSEMGLSAAQKRVLDAGGKTGAARAKAALQMNPEAKVPFSALRKIDRDLGAEGRGGIVGTMAQGEARALKEALNQDFDTFFRQEGTGLGAEFQQHKQAWSDFRTNFDKSILGQLLDERAGDQAQNFIGFLQKGDAKSNKQLGFILDNASPETRDAIRGHMVAKMAQNSLDEAGNLNPAALAGELKQLRKNGTFEMYFDDPAQRQTLVDTVQKMTAADPTVESLFRDTIKKTLPEDVPRTVFEPGNISYTDKFHTISTPQQYQEAVGAWAADLLARRQDMTPAELHKTLAPMAVKHDGVSQLDLMFGHIPGAADKISAMVTAHRTPAPAPGAVKETLPEMKDRAAVLLKETQAENTKNLNEAKRLHDEAKQEFAAAKRLVIDTRAAGSQVTGETREKLTQAVREAERKQREAKAFVDTATQDAKDKLLAAKRDMELTPSGAKRPQGGQAGLHRGIQAGALFGLLSGIVSHNPWVATTTGGILAYEIGRGTKNALFRTQQGQNFLRSYVPQRYGTKAATFAAQALGQAAGDETNMDENAVADAVTGAVGSALESVMPTGQ